MGKKNKSKRGMPIVESKEAEEVPVSARERRVELQQAHPGNRQRRRSASVTGVELASAANIVHASAASNSQQSGQLSEAVVHAGIAHAQHTPADGLLSPSSRGAAALLGTASSPHGPSNTSDAVPRLQTVERGSVGGSTHVDVESLHTFEGTLAEGSTLDRTTRSGARGSTEMPSGRTENSDISGTHMEPGKAHVTFSIHPRQGGPKSAIAKRGQKKSPGLSTRATGGNSRLHVAGQREPPSDPY